MTNQPPSHRRATLTRAAMIYAPLCMLAYGVIRLGDPDHGPGPAWTAGHLFLLAGVLQFALILPALHRLTGPARGAGRLGASAATLLGLTGTLAVAAQASIDLVVGLRAADRPEMARLFEEIQSHPGVLPAVYTVGPTLFYVGLLWLLVHLAVQRRVSPWRPVMVVLGTATSAVSLDLLPLGALFFTAALLPRALPLTAPRVQRLG
ncbi:MULTISPECIES: hypothetical protein [unclassified Streptomyces]|uniref:hypothetical protein n=1 Tax=unclassified Streptomyces TaxID=2593676 RepID=UPI000690BBB5|nr:MULTISPECIES: hypothetical protein [unclassified Streptomyces]